MRIRVVMLHLGRSDNGRHRRTCIPFTFCFWEGVATDAIAEHLSILTNETLREVYAWFLRYLGLKDDYLKDIRKGNCDKYIEDKEKRVEAKIASCARRRKDGLAPRPI